MNKFCNDCEQYNHYNMLTPYCKKYNKHLQHLAYTPLRLQQCIEDENKSNSNSKDININITIKGDR